jgi:hypothetical protein
MLCGISIVLHTTHAMWVFPALKTTRSHLCVQFFIHFNQLSFTLNFEPFLSLDSQ